MEESILFPERGVLFIDVGLGDLEGHVFISDFRDVGDEEDAGEDEDEDSDGEVDPLHALEGRDVVGGGGEEGVRAQDGANDRADCVEGLGEVDSDFRVPWRTADYSAQYPGFFLTASPLSPEVCWLAQDDALTHR